MTHRLEAHEEPEGVLVFCADCGVTLTIPVALPDCEPLVVNATAVVAPARTSDGPDAFAAAELERLEATGRVESDT